LLRPTRPAPSDSRPAYTPVHKFDPKRDAGADIQDAIAEAQRTGKRIILDVGGDWCQYCHQMDEFFEKHPEILRQRDVNFVTVAVYYGKDNKNQAALSRYSKILGVPHFLFSVKTEACCIHSTSSTFAPMGATIPKR